MTDRADVTIVAGYSAGLIPDGDPVWQQCVDLIRARARALVDGWGEGPAAATTAPPKRQPTARAVARETLAEDIIGWLPADEAGCDKLWHTAAGIAAGVSADVSAVSRVLTKLVRSGAVLKSGSRRGSRYRVATQKTTLAGVPIGGAVARGADESADNDEQAGG